ncbi:hypothetical protein PR048_001549 [Dryococelus australis]|uniref:DDE Tnp4 domain-containing protein n=1 Tax=Dryococelus australis TaxID=614101 RepID=A0ABQ9IHT3_9NEOP|nr:hypothetical protein PR048_001549 [Dryococelus australis]
MLFLISRHNFLLHHCTLDLKHCFSRLIIEVRNCRLAVTLRYLTTGDSYTSLQYLFRMSKQSIGRIIPDVCAVLVQELKEYVKIITIALLLQNLFLYKHCTFFSFPITPLAWKEISKTFEVYWNLPQCVGALDGKYVVLQAPVHSESDFYNYEFNFGIVLLALVDDKYNYLLTDVGFQGRLSDGGVFKNAKLYNMLSEDMMGLPLPEELSRREMKIAVFVLLQTVHFLYAKIL